MPQFLVPFHVLPVLSVAFLVLSFLVLQTLHAIKRILTFVAQVGVMRHRIACSPVGVAATLIVLKKRFASHTHHATGTALLCVEQVMNMRQCVSALVLRGAVVSVLLVNLASPTQHAEHLHKQGSLFLLTSLETLSIVVHLLSMLRLNALSHVQAGWIQNALTDRSVLLILHVQIEILTFVVGAWKMRPPPAITPVQLGGTKNAPDLCLALLSPLVQTRTPTFAGRTILMQVQHVVLLVRVGFLATARVASAALLLQNAVLM